MNVMENVAPTYSSYLLKSKRNGKAKVTFFSTPNFCFLKASFLDEIFKFIMMYIWAETGLFFCHVTLVTL